MKNFKEHIVSKNFEDKLFNILKEHINIELFVNYNDFYEMINEELGHFSNYKDLIDFISYYGIFENERYKENKDYEILIDCSKFNTFFKKINLHIIKDKYVYGGYKGIKNNVVEFDLHINDGIPNEWEIKSVLLHELMHAYEDINRINNGEKSIFDYFSDEYVKAFRNVKSNIYEYKILGQCKYFLNDKEQRAYFGQLEETCDKLLDQYNITHFDYTEFREKLQKSGVWKIYFDCGTFIVKMKSMSEDDKKYFVDAYNKEWNKNVTFSELRKEFTNAWNKFYKKFNQLLPKIVCDLLLKRRKNTTLYISSNDILFDVKRLEKYKV